MYTIFPYKCLFSTGARTIGTVDDGLRQAFSCWQEMVVHTLGSKNGRSFDVFARDVPLLGQLGRMSGHGCMNVHYGLQKTLVIIGSNPFQLLESQAKTGMMASGERHIDFAELKQRLRSTTVSILVLKGAHRMSDCCVKEKDLEYSL